MRQALFVLLLPSALLAQDPPRAVGGALDLGYVSSSGNSRVTTFSLGEKLEWKATSRVRVTQVLRSIYGKANDSVTAKSLNAAAGVDYTFIHGIGLTAAVGYEKNRFAGIDRRLDESFGLVWRFASSAADSVRFETGMVWTQQRNVAGEETDFTSVRLAFWYKRPIVGASYVQETFEALPNLDTSDDWRINSETAVVAPISRRIGLKFAYVIRHDNLPEPTFVKTDKILTAGVQVTY